jgi:hypothetical protein
MELEPMLNVQFQTHPKLLKVILEIISLQASTQPTLSFTTDSSQARTYNEDQIKQGGNLYHGYKKEFASTEEIELTQNKTINIALGAGGTGTNKISFKGLIPEKKTKNVGKLMHIHVATGYILEVFKSLVNDKGEIILYDFLDSLMKGIQRALGNVNDFEVVYDNESNIFKIIDNTYIPGSKNISKKIKEKPYIINVNVLKENFGSFVKSVSISSEISKDLAAELSIAATANSETSNQIGVNGSRFAHLNRGCENRIIVLADNASLNPKDNSTTENASLETESPDLVYTNNMQRYNEFLKNMFIKNTGGFGTISDDEISEFTNTIPDYWNYKLGQEESIAGKSSGRGFIPINLSLTMDGLSGMKIYEKFTINNEYLPSNYVGVIDFIIKGISHKITDKGWETSLETFCIPSIEADVDGKVTTTTVQNTSNPQPASKLPNALPTPNADRLRGVLSQLGYTEKGNEISNGGDINLEMSNYSIAVFQQINSLFPDLNIRITGGNDLYHQNLSYNSRHKRGVGLDFTISPPTPSNIDKVENVLKGFAAGNYPNARYLNEYDKPTGAATAKHFHLSWGRGTEGQNQVDNALAEANNGQIKKYIV